jgi:acetoin utilization deacetylase AcuC-like enzyme
VRVIYSPTHLLHDPSFEIAGGVRIPAWEVTGRAEAIRGALAADPAFETGSPVAHGLDPILDVHDPGLVGFLESAWSDWRAEGRASDGMVADTFDRPGLRGASGVSREPRGAGARFGYWGFDTTTPIVAGTWAATRDAVDVALTAADAVLGGEPVAYGLCRPPGHHAGRALFGGYCYLNNAAIATQWLVRRGAGRVGILDVDYHHGNGTQEIFWERGDVAYASIHGDPARAYPFFAGYADETGGGPGAGATFNQPQPAGLDDSAYLTALERALDWLAGRHDGLLVVSLGVDTYDRDPICDFALTTAAYHAAGRRVADTGAQLLVLQEGGYFLPHLGENVRAWLRGAGGLGPDRPVRGMDDGTATT